MTDICVARIYDQNNFNRIVVTRAFSSQESAIAWAIPQTQDLIRRLAESGEELLDIVYMLELMSLDDTSVNSSLTTFRS